MEAGAERILYGSTRASARVRIETTMQTGCRYAPMRSTRASARVRIETLLRLVVSPLPSRQHTRLGAGED